MRIILCCLLFVSSLGYSAENQDFIPFSTDYCTGYAEGTRAQPNLWKHCCVEHDLYFSAGGSLEDRKATDLRLKSCIEATGEVAQARLIYLAVTIGGSSPIRFKTKQWGNAWEKRERYLELTEIETALVLQYVETIANDVTPGMKQSFKEQLNGRLDHK